MSTASSIQLDQLIPAILAAHPQVRPVLDRYGLHGCGGRMGPHETLAFFARAHGVDPERLLRELESARGPADRPGPQVQSGPDYQPSPADTIYRRFFKAGIVAVLSAGAAWGALLLLRIAAAGSFTAVPLHQVNAHGHAQIFGWVGLFVMGFAFQAFPRFKHTSLWRPKLALLSFYLMIAGLVLRVVSEPLSTAPLFFALGLAGGILELSAVALFVTIILRTLQSSGKTMEAYDYYVVAALGWFALQACWDLALLYLTTTAASPSVLIERVAAYQPPLRDFQVLGFAGFMILGVAQRFLPGIYGLPKIPQRLALALLPPLAAGVLGHATFSILRWRLDQPAFSWAAYGFTWLFALAALLLTARFGLLRSCPEADRSFKFYRAALIWFYVSLTLMVLTPLFLAWSGQEFSHAYSGASRHAITVGFISLMILGVAAKVVPTLAGADPARLPALWLPFGLVNFGCALRVVFQILTDFSSRAFPVAGISGLLEVTGIAVWGVGLWRLMAAQPQSEPLDRQPQRPLMVTPDMRVGWLLRAAPETLAVFLDHQFLPLASPVLRNTLARSISIREACRLRGVDLWSLLDDLNQTLRGRTPSPCDPR